MSRYRVSAQSSLDEVEIWLYVARRSPDAADRLMATIERTYQSLAKFPRLGQRCEELGEGLRCSPVGRYVVYYRAIQDGVEVLRVIPGARDVRNMPGMSGATGDEETQT